MEFSHLYFYYSHLCFSERGLLFSAVVFSENYPVSSKYRTNQSTSSHWCKNNANWNLAHLFKTLTANGLQQPDIKGIEFNKYLVSLFINDNILHTVCTREWPEIQLQKHTPYRVSTLRGAEISFGFRCSRVTAAVQRNDLPMHSSRTRTHILL